MTSASATALSFATQVTGGIDSAIGRSVCLDYHRVGSGNVLQDRAASLVVVDAGASTFHCVDDIFVVVGAFDVRDVQVDYVGEHTLIKASDEFVVDARLPG